MKACTRLLSVLVFIACCTRAFAQGTLIPLGSVWKYRDDGSDLGTAWRAPGFDDSAWASGPAQLGYGDGDEATVVAFVDADPVTAGIQKNATTYFRSTFTVANPAAYTSLALFLKYDDAGAVYLNGTEVARTANLAAAAPYGTYATGGSKENATQTWPLSPALLLSGTNTIAVEIHQNATTSSDISFDLSLSSSPYVTRGPYLQKAAPDAVTIRWRTDVATDSRVNFGTVAGNLSQRADDAPATTEHEVRLTGLTPETLYHYSVGSTTGTFAAGADFTFTTPPIAGTPKSTRIWVIGDAGTTDGNQAAVRDAFVAFNGAQHTDVWLMLGDNAYNSGTDTEFQAAMFDMYPALLRKTLLWSTVGNHETAQLQNPLPGTVPYFDIFSLPKNGEGGGLASGKEEYYSFDYGDIHFICLDAMTSDRSAAGAMATWLTNDLGATTRKWIIAFWHHPPYTKGSHDSDSETQLIEMRENMLPILESGGVDLVLSGHSHCYERSCLLDGHYDVSTTLTGAMKVDAGDGREAGDGAYGKDPVPHAGAVYAVCGSSGRISGGALNHPAMIASLNVLGSLVLDVNGGRLDGQFLDDAGVVRDHFTLLKTPLVTVSASPVVISEDAGQPAVVTLSRTRGIADPVTVTLAMSGTATMGADYQTVTLPFTIPAGAATASFDIVPLHDELAEGTETIVATGQSGENYRVHRDSRTASTSLLDSANANWRVQHFGANANTPSIAGDAADPDGDGIPNLLERAFGLDPWTPSISGLPAEVPGNFLTLSFRRPAGVEDLLYSVQVSPALSALGWNDGSRYHGTEIVPSNAFTTEVTRTGANPETIIVRDNTPISGGGKRFMRVKVTRP